MNIMKVFILPILSTGWLAAPAQTTSTVAGRVVDQNGGALPGVAVTVREAGTRFVRNVTTGPQGRFIVASLPAGTYQLTAELSDLVAKLQADDVVIRGIYDVGGFRADADFMIWWHAPTSDALQKAYHALRRSRLGRSRLRRTDPGGYWKSPAVIATLLSQTL